MSEICGPRTELCPTCGEEHIYYCGRLLLRCAPTDQSRPVLTERCSVYIAPTRLANSFKKPMTPGLYGKSGTADDV